MDYPLNIAHADPIVDGMPDARTPQAGDDPDGIVDPQAAVAAAAASGVGGDASPAHGEEDPVAAQQAADDAEFLDKMRGWLMTVATLFVGMAFQAAMHPPVWMPKDYYRRITTHGEPASDFETKDDDAKPAVKIRGGGLTVRVFIALNTGTFATGLVLLVTLLVMKKAPSRSDMKRITCMVVGLAITVACTFASGVSGDPFAALLVLTFLVIYAAWTVVNVKGWLGRTIYRNWSRLR
ncbi:hypothetical protein VPH35_062627 [Triticum aestivum]